MHLILIQIRLTHALKGWVLFYSEFYEIFLLQLLFCVRGRVVSAWFLCILLLPAYTYTLKFYYDGGGILGCAIKIVFIQSFAMVKFSHFCVDFHTLLRRDFVGILIYTILKIGFLKKAHNGCKDSQNYLL